MSVKEVTVRDFISIDFETGNPKRVSACAVGYAKVVDGQIIETNGFLIKPIGGHASFQSKTHGIKEEHTIDKPNFGELFSELEEIFDFPLVAYSLFDKQVLNALLDYFGLRLSFEYTDTCAIAKQILPDLRNHKLITLAKHFNLPEFKHHDAEEDAIACAHIYLKCQGSESGNMSSTQSDDIHEFKGMMNGILADDVVNYKEAFQLLYWLEDHQEITVRFPGLYTLTKTALEDNDLDGLEANEIRISMLDALRNLEK